VSMRRKKSTSSFSQIPAVDVLLEHPAAQNMLERYSRPFVRDAVRECLDGLRAEIRDKEESPGTLDLSPNTILRRVEALIERKRASSFKRVINATGILLHTNIGRALLADEAVEAMREAAEAACNLELDLESGKRSHRDVHVEDLLCQLTFGLGGPPDCQGGDPVTAERSLPR